MTPILGILHGNQTNDLGVTSSNSDLKKKRNASHVFILYHQIFKHKCPFLKFLLWCNAFFPCSLASLPGRCPWKAQDSRWALSCFFYGFGLTFPVKHGECAVKCIKSYSNSRAVLFHQIGSYSMFCHENCKCSFALSLWINVIPPKGWMSKMRLPYASEAASDLVCIV